MPPFRPKNAVRTALGALLAVALLAAPGAAQQDGKAGFTITDIRVDAAGKTGQQARETGFRAAQRQAWAQLYARMTGAPASAAPRLPDSAIDAMVAGIDIQRERLSSNRYIATLSVVFDRGRAGQWLGGRGEFVQSPPMLLVPVLVDGGVRTSYAAGSPWLAAWTRFQAGASPIDYVRAAVGPESGLVLNAWQAMRSDRSLWRTILDRYDADNVLIAEAQLERSYPGGPVRGVFTGRFGPDGRLVSRFGLRVRSSAQVPALLDAGIKRLDAGFAAALRQGQLAADPLLAMQLEIEPIYVGAPSIAPVVVQAGTELIAATPDAATLAQIEQLLRTTTSVDAVTLSTLTLGGNSVLRVSHAGGIDWLGWHLDRRGWRIVSTAQGLVLRPREPSDPPLAEPAPPPDPPAAPAPPADTPTAAQEEGGPVDLLPATGPGE